jgi:foldase protein PrsA
MLFTSDWLGIVARPRRSATPGATQAGRVAATVITALMVLTVCLSGCGGGAGPTLAATPPPTSAPAVTTDAPPTATPSQSPGGQTEGGRPLIARVNGQPIFLDVYEKQVTQTERALSEQGILAQGAAGDAQRTQVRENVLKGLIDQALIEQAAAQMGITVTADELNQSLQVFTGADGGSLDDWLAANGMTMDELVAMQSAQLLAGKVIAAVSAAVPTSAEQVHARHIFVAEAAKAQALAERLKAGENFAALAQQESEDTSTAANGGDLGWFPRDVPMMPAVLVETAFALQVGQVSEPVQSEAGYHIVRVDAREASRPLSPELLLYAQQSAFEKWLAEQRSKATIERYQVG